MASKSCQLLRNLASKSVQPRSIFPFKTAFSFGSKTFNMATLATYRVPKVENENNVCLNRTCFTSSPLANSIVIQKHYAKGSPDRKALEAALHEMGQKTLEVPTIIDGEEVGIAENYVGQSMEPAMTVLRAGQHTPRAAMFTG